MTQTVASNDVLATHTGRLAWSKENGRTVSQSRFWFGRYILAHSKANTYNNIITARPADIFIWLTLLCSSQLAALEPKTKPSEQGAAQRSLIA